MFKIGQKVTFVDQDGITHTAVIENINKKKARVYGITNGKYFTQWQWLCNLEAV